MGLLTTTGGGAGRTGGVNDVDGASEDIWGAVACDIGTACEGAKHLGVDRVGAFGVATWVGILAAFIAPRKEVVAAEKRLVPRLPDEADCC